MADPDSERRKKLKDFHHHAQLLLTDKERAQIFGALRQYQEDRSCEGVVRNILRVLRTPKKLDLLAYIRSIILPEHVEKFDALAPYSKMARPVPLSTAPTKQPLVHNGNDPTLNGAVSPRRNARLKKVLFNPNSDSLLPDKKSVRSAKLNIVTFVNDDGVLADLGFRICGGANAGLGIYVASIVRDSPAALSKLGVFDQIVEVNGISFERINLDSASNLLGSLHKMKLIVKQGSGQSPNVPDMIIMNPWSSLHSSSRHMRARSTERSSRSPTVRPPSRSRSATPPRSGRGRSPYDGNIFFRAVPGVSSSASDSPAGETVQERKINLVVQQSKDTYGLIGFNIRGGSEYGLGIYVSSVDQCSLAEECGLRPGDQVLDANGRSFASISHKDAVEYIRSHKHIILTVKATGKIPEGKHLFEEFSWITPDGQRMVSSATPDLSQSMPLEAAVMNDHSDGTGISNIPFMSVSATAAALAETPAVQPLGDRSRNKPFVNRSHPSSSIGLQNPPSDSFPNRSQISRVQSEVRGKTRPIEESDDVDLVADITQSTIVSNSPFQSALAVPSASAAHVIVDALTNEPVYERNENLRPSVKSRQPNTAALSKHASSRLPPQPVPRFPESLSGSGSLVSSSGSSSPTPARVDYDPELHAALATNLKHDVPGLRRSTSVPPAFSEARPVMASSPLMGAVDEDDDADKVLRFFDESVESVSRTREESDRQRFSSPSYSEFADQDSRTELLGTPESVRGSRQKNRADALLVNSKKPVKNALDVNSDFAGGGTFSKPSRLNGGAHEGGTQANLKEITVAQVHERARSDGINRAFHDIVLPDMTSKTTSSQVLQRGHSAPDLDKVGLTDFRSHDVGSRSSSPTDSRKDPVIRQSGRVAINEKTSKAEEAFSSPRRSWSLSDLLTPKSKRKAYKADGRRQSVDSTSSADGGVCELKPEKGESSFLSRTSEMFKRWSFRKKERADNNKSLFGSALFDGSRQESLTILSDRMRKQLASDDFLKVGNVVSEYLEKGDVDILTRDALVILNKPQVYDLVKDIRTIVRPHDLGRFDAQIAKYEIENIERLGPGTAARPVIYDKQVTKNPPRRTLVAAVKSPTSGKFKLKTAEEADELEKFTSEKQKEKKYFKGQSILEREKTLQLYGSARGTPPTSLLFAKLLQSEGLVVPEGNLKKERKRLLTEPSFSTFRRDSRKPGPAFNDDKKGTKTAAENNVDTFRLPSDALNPDGLVESALYGRNTDDETSRSETRPLSRTPENGASKQPTSDFDFRSRGSEKYPNVGVSSSNSARDKVDSVQSAPILKLSSTSLDNASESFLGESTQRNSVSRQSESKSSESSVNEVFHSGRIKKLRDSFEDLRMVPLADNSSLADQRKAVGNPSPGARSSFASGRLATDGEAENLDRNNNEPVEPVYAVVQKPREKQGKTSSKSPVSHDLTKDQTSSMNHTYSSAGDRVDSDGAIPAKYFQNSVVFDVDQRKSVGQALGAGVESGATLLSYEADRPTKVERRQDVVLDDNLRGRATPLSSLRPSSIDESSASGLTFGVAPLGREFDHRHLVVAQVLKNRKSLGISISGGRGSIAQPEIRIEGILPGGAAADCELLKRGQLLISVDAESLTDASHEEAVNIIRRNFSNKQKPFIDFVVADN